MTEQDRSPYIPTAPLSSSPPRLPATPPSATLPGPSQTSSSSSYGRSAPYSQLPLSSVHQRLLPPVPIQPYTTPPNRPNPPIAPTQPWPHHHATPHYHPRPPNAPPTPGDTAWDLRQIDVYRLDDNTCRHKLIDAIQHIQNLQSTLASTRTSLAQYTLQNSILRNESREISQRSAVETELAKREVEVLLREYAAQMPSANQLANTYYRRYRGLKRRLKDVESLIETKDAEIKRLQEYVRDSGITVPREGSKRTRRSGLKYAPRGGAWASKTKTQTVQRALKPAPTLQSVTSKSETSQESQSSGLDALGMLASQVLDSQGSQSSQKYYPPSTQSRPTPSYQVTSTPSQRLPLQQSSLLSPLPLPNPTKRRRSSRASDSTVEPDPALTESEKSPTKVRMAEDCSEEEISESPPTSQPSYASAIPIPYRTAIARDTVPPFGPRRKLNFDSNDSELLNHDV